MIDEFSGKVCVVTGAASGIGRAIAEELDGRGAALALVDLDPSVVQQQGGFRRATAHVVDVSNHDAVSALADEVARRHGSVHLLVNNAGISVAGRFEAVPADVFDQLFAVNFGGVVNGCRAFLPLLRAQSEAHIVNVCSSFAWLGLPGKSAYASSKAAVRAFSESLRAELSATSNIGVTLLFPGPVDTNLIRRGYAVDPLQQARETSFLVSRGIASQRVARACLAGIRANRARVLVGFDYRAIDLLVRLSPSLAADATTALTRRLPF